LESPKLGKKNQQCRRFDRRLHSFRQTKKGKPILGLRLTHERVLLPLATDGAYHRLLEHQRNGWRVSSIVMKSDLHLLAALELDEHAPRQGSNVLGVDINAARIAVTIADMRGSPLRQLYLAQELQRRQIRFHERRARLQQLRIWELSRQIKVLRGCTTQTSRSKSFEV
jgi:hypothetical protein